MPRLAHHLEQPGVESARTREDPLAHTLPSELSDWTGWAALPGALCPRRDPSERETRRGHVANAELLSLRLRARAGERTGEVGLLGVCQII